MKEWNSFKEGNWNNNVDVKNFIDLNYTYYDGDESFLCGPTDKTKTVWDKCLELLKEELKKGVLDIDVDHVSGINNFEAGYIDKAIWWY